MNKKQNLYFKALLIKRLGELVEHSDFLFSEFSTSKDKEIEYLDRASSDLDQSMKIRIRTRESGLMKKIHAALDRIENNIYGICETCGEDISIKRLEARLVTTKCIVCKTEEEKIELLIN